MSKRATLRCCASCMWVFRRTPKTDQNGCPQCGFGHYGARYALGNACYRAEHTQQFWFNRRMDAERVRLQAIVHRNTPTARLGCLA